MTVTSLLDLRFAADHLEDGPRALLDILADTRAFDGCLGVQVVTDVTDPAHVIAVEHWESLEHDEACKLKGDERDGERCRDDVEVTRARDWGDGPNARAHQIGGHFP